MTARCMHSASLWSISLLVLSCAQSAWAQVHLPDGPGKVELERVCKGCHDVTKSVSLRQDRDGWAITMKKMVALGTKAPDKDLELIFEYLVKNFPAGEVPPVNVNKATAIELESRLSLRRSQAAALIRYRSEHGDFKSIEDLKKVPGLDAAALEAKKDRVVF
jgi:competence protein ComEA